jgi:hypothetical protein
VIVGPKQDVKLGTARAEFLTSQETQGRQMQLRSSNVIFFGTSI